MYNIEIDKLVKEIENRNAKNILIQLPDGLKPKAEEIVNAVESRTGANAYIWLGGCFGACDLPLGVDDMGIDLMFAFGHNIFRKEYW
ncbi:MAG: diphthamide synthesis protein [Nanoarchaeota archaeon]